MDKFIVLLDTNIYDASNYSFTNAQFTKLEELINQDYVSLLYNSVIEGEVKEHIKKRLNKVTKQFNDLVTSREFGPFKFVGEYSEKLEKFPANSLFKKCQKNFEQYLIDCQAIKVPVNQINMETIISDYFEKKYPFEDSKPSEFKDAIIVQSLIEYNKIMDNEVCCIVSNDKGLCSALKLHEINTYSTMNDFLELVTESINSQAIKLREYLSDNYIRDDIENEISSLINTTNYMMNNHYNEFDVIDIKLIEYQVGFVDIKSPTKAKVVLEVEATIMVWFSYTDESDSFFDKETWEYLWKVDVEREEEHKVKFELTINLDIENFSDVEDYDETEVEIDDFDHKPEHFELNENTFISGEYLTNTSDDYEKHSHGNICPDCCEEINESNFALTGYCIKCSENH